MLGFLFEHEISYKSNSWNFDYFPENFASSVEIFSDPDILFKLMYFNQNLSNWSVSSHPFKLCANPKICHPTLTPKIKVGGTQAKTRQNKVSSPCFQPMKQNIMCY